MQPKMLSRAVWLIGNLLILAQVSNAACPIYLSISLAGKTILDSNIEVNWGPGCLNKPEWVGVFTEDPSISNTHPQARITELQNTSGKVLTDVKIGKLRFPKGWNRNDANVVPADYPKGKCLSYYVASFNGNELLAVECLKIQPNWMSKLQHISQMPLKSLFIPGTHASGSYISNYGKIKSILVKDYVVAQHIDVWSQLVFGIRYLDLSIGFKSMDKYDPHSSENYWIVNENMFVNQLHTILKDVKRFVHLSQEIVILDFSSFPIGFYKHPERHSDLLHLIYKEIGDIAFVRNDTNANSEEIACFELSMDDIRRNDKYVIILYPVEELPYPENESSILCPTWKRFSTGYMNTSQALDYMRLLFSKKDTSPVQDEGWIFHAVKSLEQSLNTDKLQTSKERAAIINPKVTSWLRGVWSLTANVVAMDYFSNTNIIDIAIYANLHKAFNMANKNLINFEIVSN